MNTNKIRSILSTMNLCNKSRKRRNAEYFAMRNNEKIDLTPCEKISAYIISEHKWLIGVIIAITSVYIGYKKL